MRRKPRYSSPAGAGGVAKAFAAVASVFIALVVILAGATQDAVKRLGSSGYSQKGPAHGGGGGGAPKPAERGGGAAS